MIYRRGQASQHHGTAVAPGIHDSLGIALLQSDTETHRERDRMTERERERENETLSGRAATRCTRPMINVTSS